MKRKRFHHPEQGKALHFVLMAAISALFWAFAWSMAILTW